MRFVNKTNLETVERKRISKPGQAVHPGFVYTFKYHIVVKKCYFIIVAQKQQCNDDVQKRYINKAKKKDFKLKAHGRP